MRVDLGDIAVEARDEGQGAPVLLLHALGADLTVWDEVVPLLPPGVRALRFDMRGHGRSDVPPAPYGMGALVRDAERFLEARGARDAVVVGLSIGGLIAQGLAVKRLDLVRGIVLSNTAARIGNPGMWETRIAAVRAGGIAALADATMERWFSRRFRAAGSDAPWRARLLATPVEGYLGCMAALAGADFTTTTAGLRLPALVVAGSEDGSTPPDLVRETAELIPGADYRLIRGAGHLPCVEKPAEFAALLAAFLDRIAHAAPCGCGDPHHRH